jgi:WD40 repeat protein
MDANSYKTDTNTTSRYKCSIIYDTSLVKEDEHTLSSPHHHSATICFALSSDNQSIFCVYEDAPTKIIQKEGATGENLKELLGHTLRIRSLTISNNGKLLASTSEDMTIRLWKTDSGECYQVFKDNTSGIDFVRSMVFSRNNQKLIYGTINSIIRVWNIETGKNENNYYEGQKMLNSLTFLGTSKVMLVACNALQIWDFDSDKYIVLPRDICGNEFLRSITVSNDEKLCVIGYDSGKISVFDISDLENIKNVTTFSLPDVNRVWSLAFNHKNTKLYVGCGSYQRLYILDIETYQVMEVLNTLNVGHIVMASNDEFFLTFSETSSKGICMWREIF